MEDKRFLVYRLVHSSPSEVFNWLAKNRPKPGSCIFESDRGRLEIELLARDEPLINLGLALYGLNSYTGQMLLQKEDMTIKTAVLAGTTIGDALFNTWMESSGELNRLLARFDKELLSALISNANIPVNLLRSLFTRKAPFEKLDDEKWCILLWAATGNPRIRTPFDMKGYDDYEWYVFSDCISSAWKLFELLPVSTASAQLLAELGARLIPHEPDDMDVLAVSKRWYIDQHDEDIAAFELCRSSLANVVNTRSEQFESFKDSDDIALRRSYYRRYQASKREDIRELFERDKNIFIEEALNNINLFISEDIRDELHNCCLNYNADDDGPGYGSVFYSKLDYYTKEHPEWFDEWECEIPLGEDEDSISTSKWMLKILSRRVTRLFRELITRDSEDQQPLIHEIRNKMVRIDAALSQGSGTTARRWGWMIAGIIIGWIIAKA